MDPATLEACLMMQLTLMRERLDEAVDLGRAAETCDKAGNIGKAIEIALEVEQLTYEVTHS